MIARPTRIPAGPHHDFDRRLRQPPDDWSGWAESGLAGSGSASIRGSPARPAFGRRIRSTRRSYCAATGLVLRSARASPAHAAPSRDEGGRA
jgi:hypothetical protein